jgi:D-beta-D-heptose 7-phosphate kinase/D-beta-D-heptose 1-phosphate adenosyltransferase
MNGSLLQAPLLSWDEAAAQVGRWQAEGLRVGFTNGCFDILHAGHVAYLNEARLRCDRLVAGLNHDLSVRLLKGPSRPVNDVQARAVVLGALASIDLVVLFGADKEGEDNTPCALIDRLRPDVFFKGGDYTIEQLPEAKIVQTYGGTVDIMPVVPGRSTTGIIERVNTRKDSA